MIAEFHPRSRINCSRALASARVFKVSLIIETFCFGHALISPHTAARLRRCENPMRRLAR